MNSFACVAVAVDEDTRPQCLHCVIKKAGRPRGLCNACYYTPSIRVLYPAPPRPPKIPNAIALKLPCKHCAKYHVTRPRGLCWSCYYRPGVREMHPSTSKFARRGSGVKAEIGVPFVMVITEPIELPEPTRAIPGSEAKILILMERARKRQPLFHPDDLTNATTWVPSERGRFIVPDVT